ncbi:MAG: acetylglutamate kinase [Acidimicrobiia bacterium]|nr:acetylglutamate kinase [Acidimicrobiia bacterium]MYC57468.1 acetylglutamate kinase [Acidimicrobiia bacterium]MYI30044.1 acetylglutamate kinase [Acidimicrobiia bacterium]
MRDSPLDLSPDCTAAVLTQALPYIQRFSGATVVVKCGGSTLGATDASNEGLARFAADVVLMHSVGIRPVVVHGGGPQIGDMMQRLGLQPRFVDGLRITDAETLDIARMVLVGQVNREIVSAINDHGPLAVGVSGEDAGLITARADRPELGFVGTVASVNTAIIGRLLDENLIPVVSTIGADTAGQALNINADAVAGTLAGALGAAKAVFLTNVEGLYADPSDPNSLISATTASDLEEMIVAGAIGGGMIPKVQAAVHAVRHGVVSAHIVNGTTAHVLLLELFTDAGVGTMISEGQQNS